MRAVILLFYNKRLSESRASEQNQEKPMGAGWTAYLISPNYNLRTFALFQMLGGIYLLGGIYFIIYSNAHAFFLRFDIW